MVFRRIGSKTKSLVKPYAMRFANILTAESARFSKRAFFKAEVVEDVTIRMAHQMFRVPYNGREKIRIVFIFQSASFWPSWETFWEAVRNDDRFEEIMLVCDDIISEKSQFLTARKFLKEKGIPFQVVHDVNLSEISPHIVVLQTPYDGGHRPKYLHGNNLMSRGFRVVYITYGIEIADTYKARSDHFDGAVTKFAWRVYTFSKEMIPEYKRYSKTNGDMVRALGHPKFDIFFSDPKPEMPARILKAANGRKIVLWKVHFPKKVNGKLITPSPDEYLKFAQKLAKYDNLFFVFMPHPKFYETLDKFIDRDKFISILNNAENVIQFVDDDYRGVLINCDYYIMDRSALMVEAALTKKPVIFVQNPDYTEIMTAPVQKLVDNYYSARTCQEIEENIESVFLGTDTMRLERLKVTDEVIAVPPEGSGMAIKNDILTSLIRENHYVALDVVDEPVTRPENLHKVKS